MNRFLRAICIVLVFVMLFHPIVHATETTDTRASHFFVRHVTYLHQVSTRQFEAWFNVLAVGTMDELGVSSITIQRSSDGVNWIPIRTFEKEDYPDLICTNTASHCGCVTHWGTSGYYYRALVCYYAKNSTGIGEYETYSDTVLL